MHQFCFPIPKLVLICSILFLTACSDGDGGAAGAAQISSLNGTWSGNLEDTVGTMHTLTITVSGDTITSILIDSVDQSLTGGLVQRSANVLGFTLSDTTEGGFIVDIGRQHLTFLDEFFNVGVLQKNAGALPPFVQADIAGSGSGVVVTTDFITFEEFTGSVTCDATGTCNGIDDGVGNFTATLTYTNMGRWTGTSNSAGGSSTVSVFLSEDKLFAGSWACNFAVGGFPDACSFTAWSF